MITVPLGPNTAATNNTFTLYSPQKLKTTTTKIHTVTEEFDTQGNLTTRITEDWEETVTE